MEAVVCYRLRKEPYRSLLLILRLLCHLFQCCSLLHLLVLEMDKKVDQEATCQSLLLILRLLCHLVVHYPYSIYFFQRK